MPDPLGTVQARKRAVDDATYDALSGMLRSPDTPPTGAEEGAVDRRPPPPAPLGFLRSAFEGGTDLMLGALGVGEETKANQWGQLLSAGAPLVGGAKGLRGAKAAPAVIERIEKCTEHDCFANAARLARSRGDNAVVVHGKVISNDGKVIDHAWVEDGSQVFDPTAGITTSKERYYNEVAARPEQSYNNEQIAIRQLRSGHHGPWTADEPPRRSGKGP